MNTTNAPTSHGIVSKAIERGAASYFNACRKRVPEFCRAHFRYPGAWHLNRHAFGWDLLRMPINILWAPLYILLHLGTLALSLSLFIFKPALARTIRHLTTRLPQGIPTRVQRQLQASLENELLQSPPSKHNAMHAHVLHALIEESSEHEHLSAATTEKLADALSPVLDTSLKNYALTRTAAADIHNTLISTVAGAVAMKQFTPGGLGIGMLLSALYAKHRAAHDFILGETLGNAYYTLFPPSPSYLQIFCITALVLAALAIFAAFAGLIIDPIQYHLRIHQRRLHRMLNQMEADVIQRSHSRFNPKDPYVARLMDILDAVKTQL